MLFSQDNQKLIFSFNDFILGIYYILIFLLSLFVLTACQTGGNIEPEYCVTELPCWVHNPIREDVVGGVGIVRADTQTPEETLKWGKRKAARMLAPYCGAKDEAVKKVARQGFEKGKRAKFGKCQLGYADRVRKGPYLYVYAVTGESPKETWLQKSDGDISCSPSTCQPEWICQPMGKKYAGFLGVSEPASSKSRQYRLAMSNALEQRAIIYGVTVDAEYFIAKGASGSRTQRLAFQDKNELFLPQKKHRHHRGSRPVVSESCFRGGKLYVRVLDFSLPPLKNIAPEMWKSEPNRGNRTGAVSSAGPTASGRLSDQFRLAMKRGLVQLAKAKKIKVKGTTYVRRTRSRHFVLNIQHQSTHTTVVGEVAGLSFQKVPLGQRLYLWIREPRTRVAPARP